MMLVPVQEDVTLMLVGAGAGACVGVWYWRMIDLWYTVSTLHDVCIGTCQSLMTWDLNFVWSTEFTQTFYLLIFLVLLLNDSSTIAVLCHARPREVQQPDGICFWQGQVDLFRHKVWKTEQWLDKLTCCSDTKIVRQINSFNTICIYNNIIPPVSLVNLSAYRVVQIHSPSYPGQLL